MRKALFLFIALLMTSTLTITNLNAATTVTPATEIVPNSEPKPEEVKAALEEFKSLSRKERKARIKDVKKEMRAFNKAKRAGDDASDNMVLLCILAILLPPLAVYLHQGEINTKFWISILLTLLFWIPGVIYAFIVIFGAD